MPATIYVRIRLFKVEEADATAYTPESGQSIDNECISFAALPNAAATYEELHKVLVRAIKRGADTALERIKPGPAAKPSRSAAPGHQLANVQLAPEAPPPDELEPEDLIQ